MVVRKFNYYRFFVFIVVVLSIIIGGIILIKKVAYRKTYDYKLSVVGYNEKEIEIIKTKFDDIKINELLEKEYDENLVDFINEEYFIYSNLDMYLDYKKSHKDYNNSHIVSLINTEANIDWLENEKETDTTKGYLMLVNRIYGLNEDYEVEDIIDVSSKYAYKGVKISQSIMENISEMIDAAKEEGYTFVLSDGYRSYKEQKNLYEKYKNTYGYQEADLSVARPGHSEYETGLSFNIVPYNKTYTNPKESEEYLWLYNNAHKYGFIFRFQADKKEYTLFDEFTWRLRYVGEDAATTMKINNLCFEEYYAYYINKEN